MARIAGVDLPPQKRLWVGLTSIYGIGQVRAKDISEKANVDFTKKIRELTEDEVNRGATCRYAGSARTPTRARGRVHGAARLPARNRSRARRASGNGFQLSVFSIK